MPKLIDMVKSKINLKKKHIVYWKNWFLDSFEI